MGKYLDFQEQLIKYFIKTDYTEAQIDTHLRSIKIFQINRKLIFSDDRIKTHLRTQKLKKICLNIEK